MKNDEKEPKKSKLQQQFTDALPAFLPLIAGGLLGGLETGVAAQEGANAAQQAQMEAQRNQQKMELEARQVDIQAAREAREDRSAKQDIALRERQVALAERTAAGKSLGGGNDLTAAKAGELGQLNSAEGALDNIQLEFNKLGSGAFLTQIFPTTDASKFENNRIATAQTIGTILEGGKLTDPDFEKYLNLMPSQSDSKGTATHKINTVKKMIELSRSGQLKSLQQAGFDVRKFVDEENSKIAYRKKV